MSTAALLTVGMCYQYYVMFMCDLDTFSHTESRVYSYFYICINAHTYPEMETADHKILSFSNLGYLFL